MLPAQQPAPTLQQRVHSLVHGSNRHSAPTTTSAALTDDQLLLHPPYGAIKQTPCCALPRPASVVSRQFLPHSTPKAKLGTELNSNLHQTSWEGKTMSTLAYAPAAVPMPISADSVALTRSLQLLGGKYEAPPPPLYAGGGAMPGLLRPSSTASLERRRKTLRGERSVHSANPQIGARRRARRLLPESLSTDDLVAALPSLAYSTYRPLDVFRGVAKPAGSGEGRGAEHPKGLHSAEGSAMGLHATQFEQQRHRLAAEPASRISLRERYTGRISQYATEGYNGRVCFLGAAAPTASERGHSHVDHGLDGPAWECDSGTGVAVEIQSYGISPPALDAGSPIERKHPPRGTGPDRAPQRLLPASAGPFFKRLGDGHDAATVGLPSAGSAERRPQRRQPAARQREGVGAGAPLDKIAPSLPADEESLKGKRSSAQLVPGASAHEGSDSDSDNDESHFSGESDGCSSDASDPAAFDDELKPGGETETSAGHPPLQALAAPSSADGCGAPALSTSGASLPRAPDADQCAAEPSATATQAQVSSLVGAALGDAEAISAQQAAQAAAAAKLQVAARARQQREEERAHAHRSHSKKGSGMKGGRKGGERGSRAKGCAKGDVTCSDSASSEPICTPGATSEATSVPLGAHTATGRTMEGVHAEVARDEPSACSNPRGEADRYGHLATTSETTAIEGAVQHSAVTDLDSPVAPQLEETGLAIEARSVVAKHKRGLAKRHAYRVPRHALDSRAAVGWRALSPTQKEDSRRYHSPALRHEALAPWLASAASEAALLVSEVVPQPSSSSQSPLNVRPPTPTPTPLQPQSATMDAVASVGPAALRISPPHRRPTPPMSSAGHLVAPAEHAPAGNGGQDLSSASSSHGPPATGVVGAPAKAGERAKSLLRASLSGKIAAAASRGACVSRGALSIGDVSAAFLRSRQIAGALRSAPEFKNLTDAQIAMLAHGGEERRVPRYTILYREGASAASFYVLLDGRLQHTSFHSSAKHEVSPPSSDSEKRGVCLGTEGLTGGLRRLTTVTTLEECTVLRFATHGMRIDEGGAASLAARASSQVVAAALRGNRFFEATTEAVRAEIAPLFRLVEIDRAGEHVLQEGGPADKMGMLLEGSLSVHCGGACISTLPDSDEDPEPVFGEAGLLSAEHAAETLTTLEPCKLLILPRNKFRKLLSLMPELRDSLRTRILLRKGLVAAKLRGMPSDGHAAADATPKNAVASQLVLTRDEAATIIQRVERGKQARVYTRRLRARATFGLRAAGAETAAQAHVLGLQQQPSHLQR